MFFICHIFQHGTGDRHTVKGRGSTADLIQNQQAAVGGIFQDLGHFIHLYHKGRSTGKQVIGGAHTGKDPIANTDMGLIGRHKAADLRQNGNQCHLPHKGGFTGHIGTCNHINAVIAAVHMRIVGDKQAVLQHALHHGMATGNDMQTVTVIHSRHHIMILSGSLCQGAQGIQLGNCMRSCLDPAYLPCDHFTHLSKQLILQRRQTVTGREYFSLQLFQFRGDIPLTSGKGLLADIGVGHLVGIRFGDFDIVTKDLVVADLQFGNAGTLTLAALDLCQTGGTATQQFTQTIGLIIKPLSDDAAFSYGEGRFFYDGSVDKFADIREVIHFFQQAAQQGRLHLPQFFPQQRKLCANLIQGTKIPAIGTAVHDAAHDTLDIVNLTHIGSQLVPQDIMLQQFSHSVLSALDLGHTAQRALKPLLQQAGAHGRFGMIQHPQQRTPLLSGAKRFGKLQIAASGIIQLHILAAAVSLQLANMGKVVFLVFTKVLHQGTGGQLQQFTLRKRLCRKLRLGGIQRAVCGKKVFSAAHQKAIQSVFRKIQQLLALFRALRQQHLCGREPTQFVDQFGAGLSGGGLGRETFTGGYITEANTATATVHIYGSNEVVALLLQHGGFHNSTGGDHPDHFTFYQAFGGGRIFHLLANGDLVAFCHQTADIAFCTMERHAAHRRTLRLTAITSGERQLQLPGYRFSIVKEHFIKVTQTVHQNSIFVLFFDLQVLLHHRGKAPLCLRFLFPCHIISPFQTKPRCCGGQFPPAGTDPPGLPDLLHAPA